MDQGTITKEVFGDGTLENIDEKSGKINTKVLEINSKTGLYPLYVAYSLYRHLLPVYASEKGLMADNPKDYSAEDEQVIWDEVVKNNLYVICNTKMAERITRRTLVGFRKNSDGSEIKLYVKQDRLIARVGEDKEALMSDLQSEGYWDNNKMKTKNRSFNAVVGNPPYQDSSINNHSASIYHKFIDVAYNIADYATLITPGRFLFGVGDTPEDWNHKFMEDKRFKVVEYQSDSKIYFPSVEIKGGVAITLCDTKNEPGPIGTYSAHEELRSILKILAKKEESKFSSIIYTPATYKLSSKAFSDNAWLSQVVGKEKRLRTNIFEKAAKLFESEQPKSSDYVMIVGLDDSLKRIYRWIHKEYIAPNINCEKYKVIVPEANGSGKIGEQLASPFVLGPNTGHTETFISIGSFSTEKEAIAALKYICTKFVRILLATKKVTQHTLPDVWDNIPIQNFTKSSDIDWSKNISEIDQQLYKKYGLDKPTEEGYDLVKFIEESVIPMD